MCRRSVWLVVGTLLVLTGICRAVRPPGDARELAVVTIIAPQGGGETLDQLIDSILGALRREGFSAIVESGGTLTAKESLAKNPGVHHVIADFFVGAQGRVEVNIYNQGMDSPRSLKADSLEDLRAQVIGYLESEEMVAWRLDRVIARTDFDTAMNLGLKYMVREKALDRAIAAFTRAADLKKTSSLPYVNLALCYYRQGDYAKCGEATEKGLAVDPENHDLKNQKAVLLMREGRFAEAQQILEALRSDDPVIQWNLAYVCFQKQEPEKAKEHLVRILALDPRSDIRTIAQSRLEELQEKETALRQKEDSLRIMKRTVWLVGGGVVAIFLITLVLMLLRRANRQITDTTVAGPKDAFVALGLKINVLLALVTLLTGFLNQVLSQLFGK
jgi:tetratricopeptide (TPR) repeat protein